jgi:hypothetical protein
MREWDANILITFLKVIIDIIAKITAFCKLKNLIK